MIALLDIVRKGETVLILDRKTPVARLAPVGEGMREEGAGWLADLERSGQLRRACPALSRDWFRKRPPRARGGANIVDVVLAERDDGR